MPFRTSSHATRFPFGLPRTTALRAAELVIMLSPLPELWRVFGLKSVPAFAT
jgi:hypothetical protein